MIDDKEIHEGDIMGIGDHGILAVSQSIEETVIETLAAMIDEDCELVSIYYGSDVEEADAEAVLEKGSGNMAPAGVRTAKRRTAYLLLSAVCRVGGL